MVKETPIRPSVVKLLAKFIRTLTDDGHFETWFKGNASLTLSGVETSWMTAKQ